MRLEHGRVEVELHRLSNGTGRALLLLHELYGSAADWGEGFAAWPGPSYALDFAGHGRSQWLKGGAYTAEVLAGDVDVALRHVGEACLVGAGVGAYIALLVAAARRDLVAAALLLPGQGLEGGGAVPDFEKTPRSIADLARPMRGCDPMVCFLDQEDVRPIDYVEPFARQARRLILVEDGASRPPWWQAARIAGRAEIVAGVAAGLARL